MKRKPWPLPQDEARQPRAGSQATSGEANKLGVENGHGIPISQSFRPTTRDLCSPKARGMQRAKGLLQLSVAERVGAVEPPSHCHSRRPELGTS